MSCSLIHCPSELKAKIYTDFRDAYRESHVNLEHVEQSYCEIQCCPEPKLKVYSLKHKC